MPRRSARLLSTVALLAAAVVATLPSTAAANTRVPRAVSAVDATELQQVRLINRYRASQGLRPLRIDGTLTRAAGWLTLDLGRTARFSHTDSLGRDPFVRLRAFGYPSADTHRGENIAAGHARAATTYRQWLTSPPHRANWRNPRYRAIGIARVRVPGSPLGWYWATTFGSRWTAPSH